MLKRISEIANPFHRRGGYVAPHLGLAGIFVGFVLAILSLTAVHYGASYFSHRYQASLPVPHTKALAPDHPVVGLASSGSIQISRYPSVGDQDGQGSCAAFASTWALSYEFRVAHNNWIRFSPRYAYDYYSNTYNGGNDGGSWPDQDIERAAYGFPTWRQLSEGAAPFIIDHPTPSSFSGYLHTVPHVMHQITGYAQGAGQGAVDGTRAAIASGHPVLIAFPVYPEYDNATNTNGNVVSPSYGETSRGGHENVVLGYDDNRLMPDGTRGAVLAQNQWRVTYGISGREWLSYDFLRRYSFGLEYITLGTGAPRAHAHTHFPKYYPPHIKTHPAPPVVGSPHIINGPPSEQNVRNVYTADTHVNISADINAAAHHYGFTPAGYVALMGTESGINQYAPHYPISGAGGCDYSAGLVQITVCTAGGSLGIGDGSLSQSNINYVFNYEQGNAHREVWLGARLLAQFKQQVCWNFRPLYASWNLGPAYGCYAQIYLNPSNWITQQALRNFDGWTNWEWAHGLIYYGPPPKPYHYSFNWPRWNSYRVNHHKPIITEVFANGRGKLTWPAYIFSRHQRLGGVISIHEWYPRSKRFSHGFSVYRFRFGVAYATPAIHKVHIVYVKDCLRHRNECM